MLDEGALRAALGRFVPAGRWRELGGRDGAGRLRIGVLATDAGVYAEVSNFLAPVVGGQGDYCVADGAVAGLFRFGCDVDLFYSDIEQIMSMSRAAAERALVQAAAEAARAAAGGAI